MGLKLIASNFPQFLLEALFENLRQKEEDAFFSKKTIIVPAHGAKNYLERKLASVFGVSMGFEFLLPGQASSLFGKTTPPSFLELTFLLEKTFEEKKECEIFQSFFKHGGRKDRLADRVAKMYLRGFENSSPIKKEGNPFWHLWEEIAPFFLEKKKEHHFSPMHIYGCPYFSDKGWEWILQEAEQRDIFFYYLSPSFLFWGDFLTEKEAHLLKKKEKGKKGHEELDKYLKEHHLFLAHFGKLGKKAAEILEEHAEDFSEAFFLKEELLKLPVYNTLEGLPSLYSLTGTPSFLDAVKADLLAARQEKKEIEISLSDRSLEIHTMVKGKYEETLLLYEVLLSLFEKNPETGDSAQKKALVITPDLETYAPFIHAVFGSEDRKLPYELPEFPPRSENELKEAFLKMLIFIEESANVDLLLDFIFSQPFTKKHLISEEDQKVIESFIRTSRISFTASEEAALDYLQKEYLLANLQSTTQMTLDEGIEHFAKNLFLAKNEPFFQLPYLEKLGEIFVLFKELSSDIRGLNEQKRSLQEWAATLFSLGEKYLDGFPEDTLLNKTLDKLKSSINDFETIFPFKSIHVRLENLLVGSTGFSEKKIAPVTFLSKAAAKGVPAEIIAILGAEEGVFPEYETEDLFEEDLPFEKKEIPKIQEKDRYFFLESLLLAEQHWLLFAPESEESTSIFVEDFLAYLEKSFSIQGKPPRDFIFHHHGNFPFERKNYEENQYCVRSPDLFKGGNVLFCPSKKDPPAFFDTFFIEEKKEPPLFLQLKDLEKAAKNPLKNYFEKKHEIHFFSKRPFQESYSFLPPKYALQSYAKKALLIGLEEALLKANEDHLFRRGNLGRFFRNKIQKEYFAFKKSLAKFGVLKPLFSITAEANRESIEEKEGNIFIPPLELDIEGKTVLLVGSLDYISEMGIVSFSKSTPASLAEMLPSFLFADIIRKRDGLISKSEILFLKDQKRKTPYWKGESLGALENYVRYYLATFLSPSPLLPHFIKELMQNPGQLTIKLAELPPYDHYGNLITRGHKKDNVATFTVDERWKYFASQFFDETCDLTS